MNYYSTSELERIRLLTGIAEYHGITMSQELRMIWAKDFSNYSVSEIENAWHAWRACEENERKRPRSHDIVRTIEKTRRAEEAKKISDKRHEKLVRGLGQLQDMHIDNLEKINKNTPNLHKILADCETPYEKMIVCATGLGKSELTNHPIFKSLERRFNEMSFDSEKLQTQV